MRAMIHVEDILNICREFWLNKQSELVSNQTGNVHFQCIISAVYTLLSS